MTIERILLLITGRPVKSTQNFLELQVSNMFVLQRWKNSSKKNRLFAQKNNQTCTHLEIKFSYECFYTSVFLPLSPQPLL